MLLPFLTQASPGIGGRIRQRPEDFFVQEVPAYEPSGAGEHVYCEIQKVGIPTFQAVDRIARALDVPRQAIGYAGLKDARAVARQVLSIQGVTEGAVMGLKLPQVQILWASRHINKLRIGHLRGNRFAIKIRDVEPTHVVRVRPLMDILEQRGVPNYFGEQRFGRRGNNDQLGAALIRGDDRALLGLLLGDPMPSIDDTQTLEARTAFVENTEIMVRKLQIIFGLDPIAAELRVARKRLVLLLKLRGIPPLPVILAAAPHRHILL